MTRMVTSEKVKIVCPCCGETIETDLDVVVGQHVICPACDQKFSYGRGAEDPAGVAKAEEAFVQKNAITINCPHCGTEYEADRSDFGRFVACEECGEGFVIGQTGERTNAEPVKEHGKMRQVVASVGVFGKAVSEEIGKVDWRKQWNQAQQTAGNTAKAVRGKLDEIDWEKRREQAMLIVRKGVKASGDAIGKVCEFMSNNSDAWLKASRNVGPIYVEGSKSKPQEMNEGCQQEPEVGSPPKTSEGQIPETAILPNKTIMLWSVVGVGVLIVAIAVFCLCRDDNRWTAEDERNYRESQRMEMHRWYQKMIMKNRL